MAAKEIHLRGNRENQWQSRISYFAKQGHNLPDFRGDAKTPALLVDAFCERG
jgi:hypothetical protein